MSEDENVRRLREMLRQPDKQHMRDTLLRRIFAIEHEIAFTNPFNEVDETLYQLGSEDLNVLA